MIYLFLNKLREREYLIQAEIALKYEIIYIFKDEFKYVIGMAGQEDGFADYYNTRQWYRFGEANLSG